ncbi:MAG TPA: GNAT family N-acetyltransferase [Ornithinibacter sp.]|nr:GNAT family N-acetyltransferase [Ornithinibacter sp.]
MAEVSEQVVVARNEDESRWEARIDGALAGFAAYKVVDDDIVFTHTEVDPAFEGRGVAGALARHALDEVAEDESLRVVPRCPFIKAWIARHPDYARLVRPEH